MVDFIVDVCAVVGTAVLVGFGFTIGACIAFAIWQAGPLAFVSKRIL